MSKIKERDILKLLDGKASAKKLKKLEEWASISLENALDLEKYQRIYDESQKLSSYQKVNAKKEWNSFVKSIDSSVSDNELLEYFDGLSIPAQRKKIESWKSLSNNNNKDFELFNVILSESSQLKEFNSSDADFEWQSFQEKLKSPNLKVVKEVSSTDISVVETPPSSQEAREVTFIPSNAYQEEKSNSRWMWRSVAIAASVILLSAFMWTMWQGNDFGFGGSNDELYATFTTEGSPDILTLSDGSVLSLNEYTSLTYFTNVNKINTREVTIEGKGEFNVRSNPLKPFILKAPLTGVGIRVLGTRFKLENNAEYLEVIENIEGSVRAYSLADTTVNVVLIAGDRYGFDGAKFIYLNELEKEYKGAEYDILHVLDYLMKESDWRVTSAPYSEFDGESMVTINLDQPYEDVLEDLTQQANFEYIPLDCKGCYKVLKFAPRN